MSETSEPNQEQNQEQNMRRVAMTSLAGTSIEWYDFFLYGTAAALVFNRLFFPNIEPLVEAHLGSNNSFYWFTHFGRRNLRNGRR